MDFKTKVTELMAMGYKRASARASVSLLLLGLKRCQIIRRVGPDKGGHWEVMTPERGDGE